MKVGDLVRKQPQRMEVKIVQFGIVTRVHKGSGIVC